MLCFSGAKQLQHAAAPCIVLVHMVSSSAPAAWLSCLALSWPALRLAYAVLPQAKLLFLTVPKLVG